MPFWDFAEWERRRASGLLRFVVRFGLLQAGPIYALGTAALRYAIGDEPSLLSYVTSTWVVSQIVASWVMFGVVFSLLVWFLNESRYRRGRR